MPHSRVIAKSSDYTPADSSDTRTLVFPLLNPRDERFVITRTIGKGSLLGSLIFPLYCHGHTFGADNYPTKPAHAGSAVSGYPRLNERDGRPISAPGSGSFGPQVGTASPRRNLWSRLSSQHTSWAFG